MHRSIAKVSRKLKIKRYPYLEVRCVQRQVGGRHQRCIHAFFKAHLPWRLYLVYDHTNTTIFSDCLVWILSTLTLLLVGFLEYVNWWGGGRFGPPVRSQELTGRFRWNKRHLIPLIVNFQNHYKKSRKVENWGSWKQKISENFAIFTPLLKLL